METKEIEGVEYIPKTQVDELVRSRLTKLSERARSAEQERDELAAKMKDFDPAGMRAQMDGLRSELEASRAKYQNHSAISAHGITDPDIRDMVEWSHKRSMENLAKKDRLGIGEWIDGIKSDPSKAPAHLRPHFQPPAAPTEAPEAEAISAPAETGTAPASNAGAVIPPQSAGGRDLIERATRDPEFYQANRDKIKEAWYNQKKPGPFRY